MSCICSIIADVVAVLCVLNIHQIKWYALCRKNISHYVRIYEKFLNISPLFQTLPQFGIHTNVRVCADCFNDRSR